MEAAPPLLGEWSPLGGDSPVSLVFYFLFTVSTSARNGTKMLRAFLASLCTVLLPPAVAGVFAFRPRRNLPAKLASFAYTLFSCPTACSLSRARYATNSDGSGRILLKSENNSLGPRGGRAAPNLIITNSEDSF